MRDDFGSWRYWLLRWCLVASLGILLAAIIRLSVIKSGYYRGLAFENKIVETIIPAARGEIIDRKGRSLGKSVYQYFALENGNKVYKDSGNYQGGRFEGRDMLFDLRRVYDYAESMGVITGYVGQVGLDELNKTRCGQRVDSRWLVGRGGVEEFMDCKLRGVEGRRLVEVDARGKYVRELGRQEPQMGENVELSIDGYWQEKIYKILQGKRATVIISDPKTGEILNLVSSPGFDANAFSNHIDNQKISGYLGDTANVPLMNRAISARYHPGSVFKIVIASAGLEEGVVDARTTIEDTGVIKVGDYSYSNWLWTKRGGTEGMVDMVKAIKRSNDIYFYKLGERLGVDRINHWANIFGYGQETGIELAGEVAGINPDSDWKVEVKGEKWYLGDTYHLAIGQGFLGVTSLQVNQSTNIIANNGKKCQLSILKNHQLNCPNIGIKQSTINTIKEGMVEACRSGGTAWPLFNFKTKLACKTGTAEVGDGTSDTHAWLTAFAPADNPEISITVMVERGGEGSDVAAPIVGDILKEWFNEPETIVPRREQ